MRLLILLTLGLTAVSAAPGSSQRIVGGSVTTINQYPEMAALLIAWPSWFQQECGGVVLNNRSILTAAHCLRNTVPAEWRFRLGSTHANSGGTVYSASQIINHPNYGTSTFDNDIGILRSASVIVFSNVVAPASIASATYNLADNQVVWAAGWGRTNYIGWSSEELRHVQIWTINQAVCRNNYASIRVVTDNMLCSGWLGVGGRDQCQGDSGGPLYHNRVVVGICSWGFRCGEANYPGVNARVSRYTSWIQSNA